MERSKSIPIELSTVGKKYAVTTRILVVAVAFGLVLPTSVEAELKVTPSNFAAYVLDDKKALSSSFHHRNQNEANQAAMRACGSAANGCKIIMQVDAKCIAFAESFQNGHWMVSPARIISRSRKNWRLTSAARTRHRKPAKLDTLNVKY